MTLSAIETDLITAAYNAISAVPRSSHIVKVTDHSVGAAALSSDGRVFTGINLFHFSGSACAEVSVFSNAAAAGVSSVFNPRPEGDGPKLTHVVAVGVLATGAGKGVTSPCGRCRQIFLDFYTDIKVIINDGGELRTATMDELLSFGFRAQRWD